jgi:hypothetical protein
MLVKCSTICFLNEFILICGWMLIAVLWIVSVIDDN